MWIKYKPGNGHKPSTFVGKSQQIQNKQVCYLCYILIRYFLILFALAVQANIGPWSFLYSCCTSNQVGNKEVNCYWLFYGTSLFPLLSGQQIS